MPSPGEAAATLDPKNLGLLIQLAALDDVEREQRENLAKLPKELMFRKQDHEKILQRAAESKSLLVALQKMIDQKTMESRTIADELKRMEKQLQSLKTPNEYKAMETQINDRKAKAATLQDEILDAMMALDEQRPVEKTAAETVKAAEADFLRAKQAMSAKMAECDAAIKKAKIDREALAPKIAHDLLQIYETVRRRADGVGLAPMNGEICGGCDTAVVPQRIAEILSGRLVQCPNCERILYFRR